MHDSGGGVQFCEFVGNTGVCWYLYALAYIHIIIGPLLEGELGSWPIFGQIVQLIMVIVVNIWKS